jgi:hypothetical protein
MGSAIPARAYQLCLSTQLADGVCVCISHQAGGFVSDQTLGGISPFPASDERAHLRRYDETHKEVLS